MDLRLPATDAPALPALTERERLGDSYAVISLDARMQVVELFRPALDALGAVPNSDLAARRPGRVRLGGLVVTRQHPMTARGTVFLALEDETGMVNVTLWPAVWAEFRNTIRRHALLLVDGDAPARGQRRERGGAERALAGRGGGAARRSRTAAGRQAARLRRDAASGLSVGPDSSRRAASGARRLLASLGRLGLLLLAAAVAGSRPRGTAGSSRRTRPPRRRTAARRRGRRTQR